MAMQRNDPQVMRLATEAAVDPRSALAALEGRKVRGLAGERIERAAKKLKIKLPKAKERA
jgi:hypothetical protein